MCDCAPVLDTARVFPPSPPSHHLLRGMRVPAEAGKIMVPVDVPVRNWRVHVAAVLGCKVGRGRGALQETTDVAVQTPRPWCPEPTNLCVSGCTRDRPQSLLYAGFPKAGRLSAGARTRQLEATIGYHDCLVSASVVLLSGSCPVVGPTCA